MAGMTPEEIREAALDFFASEPALQGSRAGVFIAGDIALVISGWTVEVEGPDGRPCVSRVPPRSDATAGRRHLALRHRQPGRHRARVAAVMVGVASVLGSGRTSKEGVG